MAADQADLVLQGKPAVQVVVVLQEAVLPEDQETKVDTVQSKVTPGAHHPPALDKVQVEVEAVLVL